MIIFLLKNIYCNKKGIYVHYAIKKHDIHFSFLFKRFSKIGIWKIIGLLLKFDFENHSTLLQKCCRYYYFYNYMIFFSSCFWIIFFFLKMPKLRFSFWIKKMEAFQWLLSEFTLHINPFFMIKYLF